MKYSNSKWINNDSTLGKLVLSGQKAVDHHIEEVRVASASVGIETQMKKRALELRRSNSSNKEEVQNWMRFLVFFSLRIRGLYAPLPVFSKSGCFETVGTKVLEKLVIRNSKKLLITTYISYFQQFCELSTSYGFFGKLIFAHFFEKNCEKPICLKCSSNWKLFPTKWNPMIKKRGILFRKC